MKNALDSRYMVMDDLPPAMEQLLQFTDKDDSPTEHAVAAETQILSEAMTSIIRDVYPDAFFISADDLKRGMHEMIGEFLTMHPQAEIVSLDKYLPTGMSQTVHRFGMTRTAHGEPAPRPGFEGTAEQQLYRLDSAIGNRPIILVDDCLSSGGTLRKFLEKKREVTGTKWSESVVGIVIGEGPTNQETFDGIPLKIVYPFPALQDGVMSGDLTPFGGRTVHVSSDLKTATAAPYVAPFADGRQCSLDLPDDQEYFEIHNRLLAAQGGFFTRLNHILSQPLTVDLWQKAGFPIPRSIDPEIDNVLQQKEALISSVLLQARKTLVSHQSMTGTNRNVITDFDNTLYGYKGGGSYYTAHIANAHDEAVRQMIARYKDGPDAEALFTNATKAELTSIVLAKGLGRTRVECLNDVWGNMDPEACCERLEHTIPALDRIRAGTAGKLMVLTGAPKIWIDRVLEHLGIDRGFFDEIVTCEQYSTKAKFFEEVAGTLHGPTLAIGDDIKSDVLPAIKAGMRGIGVDNRVRSLHYVSRLFPKI